MSVKVNYSMKNIVFTFVFFFIFFFILCLLKQEKILLRQSSHIHLATAGVV